MISDWMKRLFPRVRKSIRDRDWMKNFPYEFFMRSILSENLSKYEIKRYYIYIYISSQTWHNQINLDPRQDLAKWSVNTIYICHLNSKSRWQRINLKLYCVRNASLKNGCFLYKDAEVLRKLTGDDWQQQILSKIRKISNYISFPSVNSLQNNRGGELWRLFTSRGVIYRWTT